MDTDDTSSPRDRAASPAVLLEGLAGITGDGVERRHEALMDWAETDIGLPRDYAEQVYALAEEEGLEPLYALHLIRAGIGVRELEEPEQDMDEAASQQAPPEWVAEDTVEMEDVALERRLRATFRRFRSHLETMADASAAAVVFLEETDVGPVRLR
jgi:hypothetical protein